MQLLTNFFLSICMWNRSCNIVKLMYKSKNLRNYVSWDVYSRRNSQRRNSLTILALKNLCHVSPPEESPRTEMVYNIDEAGTLGHAGPETPWWQVRELKTHHSNLKSSCKQSWARDNTAATTTWPCFQATIFVVAITVDTEALKFCKCFLVPETLQYHVVALSLSRCRCREAKILSRAQLWL